MSRLPTHRAPAVGGLFHRLRGLDVATGLLGPPVLLDRRKSAPARFRLTPFGGPEWGWLPNAARGYSYDVHGMATLLNLAWRGLTGQAVGTVALDSAYTYGSAGDAVGWRLRAPLTSETA